MVVIAALVLAASHHKPTQPRWLDMEVAGYLLQAADSAVYDPQTKFFLVRDGECDGAYISILLTRDRKEVFGEGCYFQSTDPYADTEKKLKRKRLPSLATSKGVRIGDSMEAVQKRLGRPTHRGPLDSDPRYMELSYSWTDRESPDDPREYDESYTFKNDRLIEISFDVGPRTTNLLFASATTDIRSASV